MQSDQSVKCLLLLIVLLLGVIGCIRTWLRPRFRLNPPSLRPFSLSLASPCCARPTAGARYWAKS